MQLCGRVGMYADGLCRTSRRRTSSELPMTLTYLTTLTVESTTMVRSFAHVNHRFSQPGTIPTLVVPTYETTGEDVDTRYRSLRDTTVSGRDKSSCPRLFRVPSL